MENEVKLKITALVYNQTVVGTYGLVLSEEEGNRRFSVMIGEPEAQSIALRLNNKKSARPLTHDLIRNLLNVFDAELEKVLIYDMVNDVFYSELHIKNNDKVLIVDARTSDAVALAVRSDCPIFIKSEILEIVGMEVDVEVEEVKSDNADIDIDNVSNDELNGMTIEALEEFLKTAVDDEKYELAVNIRDAIKRKK